MRIALRGVPEHQMRMPDGIINQRINRKTGCPARAGEPNAIFEVFREGHVPTCDDGEELGDDPFNDPAGIDEPETNEDDPFNDPIGIDEPETEEDDSLF
jgi:penicillin-binding protein 1A